VDDESGELIWKVAKKYSVDSALVKAVIKVATEGTSRQG